MRRVFDCAGSEIGLPVASIPVWPSASDNGVGTPDDLISQLDGWPACAPVNASLPALRPSTHDSGSGWLAGPFPCDSFIHDSSPVSRRTVRPERASSSIKRLAGAYVLVQPRTGGAVAGAEQLIGPADSIAGTPVVPRQLTQDASSASANVSVRVRQRPGQVGMHAAQESGLLAPLRDAVPGASPFSHPDSATEVPRPLPSGAARWLPEPSESGCRCVRPCRVCRVPAAWGPSVSDRRCT